MFLQGATLLLLAIQEKNSIELGAIISWEGVLDIKLER